MVTKVEIISNAFTNLGKGPVSDIDPSSASPIVVIASKKYDTLLEDILADLPWRFATLVRDLNLLAAKPPIETFQNAFSLPADYLNMQMVTPFVFYRIYENFLFTNSNKIQIEYTARVIEERFPAWFILFLEYRLTTDMAMPITQQITLMDRWEKKADRQELKAKYQDSQQQPNNVVRNDDILAAHFGNASGFLF